MRDVADDVQYAPGQGRSPCRPSRVHRIECRVHRPGNRRNRHMRPVRWIEGKEAVVTTTPETTVDDVLAELAALEDPKIRAVNERHGDDHGVNLTALRAVAKRLKTQHALAGQLWGTGDTAARLVAILISRPKAYSAAELDAMLRDARVPKVHGWLVSNVVKKNAHVEELRTAWLADPDPAVAAAGWALTSDRVAKSPEDSIFPGYSTPSRPE